MTDFKDYVQEVLSGTFLPCPPEEQRLGSTVVRWWESYPGMAVIMASGGSPDDRTLGEQIVKAQLGAHGYERMSFTFDLPRYMRRHASWVDIMAKAKRLMQSGNVTVLRNGYNNIVGHVVGDHGEYNTEIGRDDPESRTITTWQCECAWDQYAWQRTRQWKKYEGRPCAHVLALYWTGLGMPLDDHNPEEHGPLEPGQKQGPPPVPGPHGGPSVIPNIQPQSVPGPPKTPGPPSGTQGPPSPSGPAQAPMAPPSAPGVLPPSPMEQLQMQMPPMPGQTPNGMPAPPNSVSVPGARMPSPFNPIQYPGGTYSKVAAEEFTPGQAVILKEDQWGLAQGKSEAHGSGQYIQIPARKPDGRPQHAEVLSQDPTTGWIEIIVSLDDNGPNEPYLAQVFVEPNDIAPALNSDPGFIRPHH